MEINKTLSEKDSLDRRSPLLIKGRRKILALSLVFVCLITVMIAIFVLDYHYSNQHLKTPTNAISNQVLTERINRLQKGVDISLWFRFPLEETDEYYANYITDDDLNFIKNAGFTHVRLSIGPEYIYDTSSQTKINARMLPFIDKGIAKILTHNLAVVVDMHDEHKTFENESNARGFVVFWKNFAHHLAQYDPNNVYLELLNEPVFDGKVQAWLELQEKLIATVREQAPNNTIITAGANWGGIEGLQQVKPYQDTNIIYSFHYYEPTVFTHQGANWSGKEYPPIANLEYPYNPTNCQHMVQNLAVNDAKDLVQEYCDRKWDKDIISNFIQRAIDWSKSNNVPIWVGEFGVYCKQTPRNSKLRWIKDVKDVFEQNHIGWTLWAYDDCFGLGAKKENGKIKYDKDVLQILDLKT